MKRAPCKFSSGASVKPKTQPIRIYGFHDSIYRVVEISSRYDAKAWALRLDRPIRGNQDWVWADDVEPVGGPW